MAMQLTAFPLRPARVHEACGPLAPSFAAAAGAQTGHVLWLRESWRNEQINPLALSAYLADEAPPWTFDAARAASLQSALSAMIEAALAAATKLERTKP